jgi:GNAT superfamily N-acetyltransferase
MSLEIRPLAETFLEDAAALASSRYTALRERVPFLPARYAEAGVLLPLLQNIAGAGPGVAALRDGQLAGFLSAWPLASFRGKRSVFSPEWANAAAQAESRRIYEVMYTQLSAAWVAGGYGTHLISLLANDAQALAGWHWLGFGMIAADAVRRLEAALGAAAGVDVRRAGPQDVGLVIALHEALRRHLAGPPTFLVGREEPARGAIEGWLHDPERAIWLAFQAGEAIAYLMIGPASDDASTIIRDASTASITAAFTREAVRGGGIATALLNRALVWAAAAGYARCAVDFEPMNPLATRFWLRHFEPVCYTLARTVDI